MVEFWTNLTYATKFSAIGFVGSFILGFVSMGILGAALYYPVSFLFRAYPALNDWQGDWVWPAMIMAGMMWSFGFILAGFAWHFLEAHVSSVIVLRCIYGFVLWGWAAIVWFGIIRMNVA
ncbi:hypothetical protein FUA23_14110 [Neolewinella aurantiaca]|uniref:Uncharacterized protein n=1 Tax=Neolewinella aurantiaca TaxID=2602767 RepID=A0A5C7FR85_9BACT|nr:hypothetical protein [Neolewinella aurantiaca]TXF88598.1 hypothetical protein FUA23_14110 [Neolewinella aurantiaca]